MTDALATFVAREIAASVPDDIAALAGILAERSGADAVLFYGSALRTGDRDGVLDFYVLLPAVRDRGIRGLASRLLWPDVSFEEIRVRGRVLRAKVATMTMAQFAAACRDGGIDTTIWARFVQPSALAWATSESARRRVIAAIADAAATAAGYAALLGPEKGTAAAYWRALFRATYTTELRVEPAGREGQIIGNAPAHFEALLPLGWDRARIAYSSADDMLAPTLPAARQRRLARRWRARRRLGKPLNAARLTKASFTFAGAGRYALWKIERHTGIGIEPTPWRLRHPVLAAPGVLWRVWRGRVR
ncbi:hypothetical protein [Stakelama saccharophila]|uniref:Uncharacterized protein n=1 Tax=Stakelama saccharophila TaxID=3075605 RepID=A0ABZ0BB39_9SPHN|nr:hypothetical protein [Stakelama sp. W311]WNO54068.1 hypothetical protein RPR59_02070 [Stakelama sp. W311]